MITDRAHHFNKGNNQGDYSSKYLLNSYETTVLDRQNMENAALFREDLEKFIVKKNQRC